MMKPIMMFERGKLNFNSECGLLEHHSRLPERERTHYVTEVLISSVVSNHPFSLLLTGLSKSLKSLKSRGGTGFGTLLLSNAECYSTPSICFHGSGR